FTEDLVLPNAAPSPLVLTPSLHDALPIFLKHPSPLVVACTGSANAYSQRHNPALQGEVMALTGRSAEARWCGRHLDQAEARWCRRYLAQAEARWCGRHLAQAWARSELGRLKHGLDRDGLEISPARSRRSSRER